MAQTRLREEELYLYDLGTDGTSMQKLVQFLYRSIRDPKDRISEQHAAKLKDPNIKLSLASFLYIFSFEFFPKKTVR